MREKGKKDRQRKKGREEERREGAGEEKLLIRQQL